MPIIFLLASSISNSNFPQRLNPPLILTFNSQILRICDKLGYFKCSSKSFFLSRMNGTGQFLLAFACALEIVHQFSHFVFFYNVTVGPTFIDYNLCVLLQSASTFALNSLQIALTVIAIDRIFATATPFL